MTPINTFIKLLVMYTTQKNSTPYSQALEFNRISLENQFNDKMCNKLEVWLKYCGYQEKLVRQQILKARKYRRTKLLYIQREEARKNKLVFDIGLLSYFLETSEYFIENSSSFNIGQGTKNISIKVF